MKSQSTRLTHSYQLLVDNKITKLEQIRQKLSSKQLGFLALGIQKNHSLRYLDLSGNPEIPHWRIFASSMEKMLAQITQHPSLKTVKLDECALTEKHIEILCKGLENNLSLHTLVIEMEELNARNLFRLANALKKNETLRSLRLSYRRIDPETGGGYQFHRLLSENTSLFELEIQGQQALDTLSISAITEGILTNSTLLKANIVGQIYEPSFPNQLFPYDEKDIRYQYVQLHQPALSEKLRQNRASSSIFRQFCKRLHEAEWNKAQKNENLHDWEIDPALQDSFLWMYLTSPTFWNIQRLNLNFLQLKPEHINALCQRIESGYPLIQLDMHHTSPLNSDSLLAILRAYLQPKSTVLKISLDQENLPPLFTHVFNHLVAHTLEERHARIRQRYATAYKDNPLICSLLAAAPLVEKKTWPGSIACHVFTDHSIKKGRYLSIFSPSSKAKIIKFIPLSPSKGWVYSLMNESLHAQLWETDQEKPLSDLIKIEANLKKAGYRFDKKSCFHPETDVIFCQIKKNIMAMVNPYSTSPLSLHTLDIDPKNAFIDTKLIAVFFLQKGKPRYSLIFQCSFYNTEGEIDYSYASAIIFLDPHHDNTVTLHSFKHYSNQQKAITTIHINLSSENPTRIYNHQIKHPLREQLKKFVCEDDRLIQASPDEAPHTICLLEYPDEEETNALSLMHLFYGFEKKFWHVFFSGCYFRQSSLTLLIELLRNSGLSYLDFGNSRMEAGTWETFSHQMNDNRLLQVRTPAKPIPNPISERIKAILDKRSMDNVFFNTSLSSYPNNPYTLFHLSMKLQNEKKETLACVALHHQIQNGLAPTKQQQVINRNYRKIYLSMTHPDTDSLNSSSACYEFDHHYRIQHERHALEEKLSVALRLSIKLPLSNHPKLFEQIMELELELYEHDGNPERLLNLAQHCFVAKYYLAGIEVYRLLEVLQYPIPNSEYQRLGEHYLELGHQTAFKERKKDYYQAARHYLERSIDMLSPASCNKLVHLLVLLDEPFQKINAMLDQLMGRDHQIYVHLLLLRAQICFKYQEYNLSCEYYREAHQLEFIQSHEDFYCYAFLLYRDHQFIESEKMLKFAFEKNPIHPESLRLIIKLYYHNLQFQEAFNYSETLRTHCQGLTDEDRIQRAKILYKGSEFNKNTTASRELEPYKETSNQFSYYYLKALIKEGEYEKAIEEGGIVLNKLNPALNHDSRILYYKILFRKAEAHYHQAEQETIHKLKIAHAKMALKLSESLNINAPKCHREKLRAISAYSSEILRTPAPEMDTLPLSRTPEDNTSVETSALLAWQPFRHQSPTHSRGNLRSYGSFYSIPSSQLRPTLLYPSRGNTSEEGVHYVKS